MPSIARRRFLQLSVTAGAGTARSTETAGADSATDAGDVEWTYETADAVSSSATVVGGTVYIGSHDDHVYALDADTGEEEWAFDAGAVVTSSPGVVDGSVFVGTRQNSSRDGEEIITEGGHVVAIDADTGEEEWTFTAEGGFGSSPTVVDGTLYVGSSYNVARERRAGGALHAVDAGSGEEEWVFDAPYPVRSSPTVVDGTVYVESGATYPYLEGALVLAIDADSGDREWDFDVGNDMTSSPTVADGTVYAVSDTVYAIEADEGREAWTFDAGFRFPTSPTVADGVVYVGGNDQMVAIDADGGAEQWSFEAEAKVKSSPTVAGGIVFFGVEQSYRPSGHEATMEESEVYALDVDTGEVEWTFENDGDETHFHSSPTVVAGTLYIGCIDGNAYALDAGVDGASEDSRVELGTLGHHHTWAGEPAPEGTRDSLSIGDSSLTAAGALAGVGGAAYLLNRWRGDRRRDDP